MIKDIMQDKESTTIRSGKLNLNEKTTPYYPPRRGDGVEGNLARMKLTDDYWKYGANPLVDDNRQYHNPTECIKWLNETDTLSDSLVRISKLSLQFDLLYRKHFMTVDELKAPLITWSRDEIAENASEVTQDLAGFVKAFNYYQKLGLEITRIENHKKLQVGFVVNQARYQDKTDWHCHFIRFGELNPIWRPKSERDYASEMAAQWRRNTTAVEKSMDEHVGHLFKTSGHDLGPDWAGVLAFNLPTLSTTTGGSQHAMPMPRDRYKVMWVHLPTITKRQTETYSATEFDKLLMESLITETNGFETTPLRLRGESVGGGFREKEEWERIYPDRKPENSSD